MKIGFIGQGFVGKSYADDFAERGFSVVRYSLEPQYAANKEALKECDFVLIAVPTPTTPSGFDASIVKEALGLVGAGKTAVIKSTVVPGTTEEFQRAHPEITVLFSPEFLLVATAAEDAKRPIMNIVGYPSDAVKAKAEEFLALLPESPYQKVVPARDAEFIKYAHNIHGFYRILFTNLLYDLVAASGADWDTVEEAMRADPYLSTMASYYNKPVHKSGRGAGGGCFIKDFAAFRQYYEQVLPGDAAIVILRALEAKNLELLKASGKDQDLVAGVYGAS